MDEEMSIGVKILLERAKSNPEEVMDDYGKWGQLREAVYGYVEKGERRPWIRGLRPDEIDLLYEAFSTHARQIFDDYVLKNVLSTDEKKEEKSLLFPTPVRDPNYNPYLNVAQPGSWEAVKVQTSNTSVVAQQSLVARLKQELGIK